MATVLVVEIDEQGNEISNTEKSFDVTIGDIIFDAADRANCKLPHGCLAGSCGSCRIMIIEGAENLLPEGAIENNTITNIVNDYGASHFTSKHKIRLSCRARLNKDGTVKIATLKK